MSGKSRAGVLGQRCVVSQLASSGVLRLADIFRPSAPHSTGVPEEELNAWTENVLVGD